ncbi:MAG: hypothetical protein Q9214_002581 [Letrouitia sp. 1 TL-2023]
MANFSIAASPKTVFRALRTLGLALGLLTYFHSYVLTRDSPTAQKTGYEYHGFDISPAHFPQEQDGFRFFQHDILTPFPFEFHGRYDVVNIRLLVLALKKEQFKTAAENAAQLLKKGGTFQWLELDPASQSYHPAMPITTQIQSIMRTAGRANNISTTPSAEVQDAFTAIGLTDVIRKEYTAEGKPEVEEGLKGWVVGGAKSGLGNALVRGAKEKGEDEEQAREKARKLLSEFEAAISSGETKVRMPVIVVVGRRAE